MYFNKLKCFIYITIILISVLCLNIYSFSYNGVQYANRVKYMNKMLAFRNQNVDDITSGSDNREGFKWLSEIIENNNNNMFPTDSVYNSIVDYNVIVI